MNSNRLRRGARFPRAKRAGGVAISVLVAMAFSVHTTHADAVVDTERTLAAQGAPAGYDVSTDWVEQLLAQHLPATATMLQHMKTRVTSTVSVPVKPLGATSRNWAGYVRNIDSRFHATFVHDESNAVNFGSFPQVSSWTGIGGTNGNGKTPIQAGVIDDSPPITVFELSSSGPQTLFQVNDGDSIETSIAFDVNTARWDITVADDATGQYWSNEYDDSPDQNTAEWITEDSDASSTSVPNLCCFFHGTDDYQESDVSSDEPFTTTTGTGGYYDLTMCAPAGGQFYPGSVPSNTGDSFTVYQSSSSC